MRRNIEKEYGQPLRTNHHRCAHTVCFGLHNFARTYRQIPGRSPNRAPNRFPRHGELLPPPHVSNSYVSKKGPNPASAPPRTCASTRKAIARRAESLIPPPGDFVRSYGLFVTALDAPMPEWQCTGIVRSDVEPHVFDTFLSELVEEQTSKCFPVPPTAKRRGNVEIANFSLCFPNEVF